MAEPIDTSTLGPISTMHVGRIFVFGANEAGRHGKGSALEAKHHWGAKQGQGFGPQGRSFGIPTKDANLRVLPLEKIAVYVGRFIAFAEHNPLLEFQVVCIGCGFAGYKPEQIAPLFKDAPANCIFQGDFKRILQK